MKKYFSRLAVASALTLATGTALAQPAPQQKLGMEESLTGCMLDNQRFTMIATAVGSAQDAARADLGRLTKEYIDNVKGIVRVIAEDYASPAIKERAFFDHLTFALNDYAWKFNQANNSSLGLSIKAAGLIAENNCKTVTRINPKP